METVSQLADRALADGNWNSWRQWTKALVEYRRGRFASAINWLQKRREKAPGKQLVPYYDLLLAMAHHRFGEADKAREWLGKGFEHMAETYPEIEEGSVIRGPWWDWLYCHILLREAEELMGKRPAWIVPAVRAKQYVKTGRWQQAITEFSKAIEQAPKVWQLRRDRASALGQSMRWDEALADYDKAIALNARDAELRKARGGLHARRGAWAQAAQDFAAAVELDPDRLWHRFCLAPLRLYLGDREGHRDLCRDTLRRFADAQDPGVASRTVKMCLLVPGAVDDVEAAAALADRAVAIGANHKALRWCQWAKALAEYRRGRFASAIDWLRRSQERTSNIHLEVYCRLLLAMAHHQLGKAREGRQWLHEARALMETLLPRTEGGSLGGAWHEWLMCQILRREAEATLARAGAPPAGQEGGPEKQGKQE
jgi:tetratricopeptide (TPR) repeat protein